MVRCASAVILLTEGDFQTITDPSIGHSDADFTNQNPYGPNISNVFWQFTPTARQGSGHNISYDNVGFIYNRWDSSNLYYNSNGYF